ncbi:MAG: sodium/glutamate symporter [Cetobacterium sp.]|uniref:sodium/glutamate symporter n=3 Tax=Cetobacterium sp. TaxID=2071632 RepID=UPI002FCBF265
MNSFLSIFSYLSFLLILGVIIKNKVKIFQDLFIPSSVIGGFIGLFLGSSFTNNYFELIPSFWQKDISSLPGMLIVPIIISVPLGLNFGSRKKSIKNVINMSGILFIVTFTQLLLGYSIAYLYKSLLNKDLYSGFGSELNSGFAGGHGTAGLVSRTFKELGSQYWNLAQGITVTIATIGLILGIFFGIYQINKGSKSGKTKIIKDVSELPIELKKGYYKDILKQESLGRETMLSTSIDTLAFHLAIIMSVCGLSQISLSFFKKYNIFIISKLSLWSYGMIVMLMVWYIIKKMGLDWSVDYKVRGKITGTLTEFAVVSAISTLPFKAVSTYFVTIFVICLIGLVLTWNIILLLSKRYFKEDFYFERALAMFGTSTGVFITGLLLLRICDPKLESKVIQDYSLGFTMTALLGPILIASCIQLSFLYGFLIPVAIMSSLTIINIVFLELYNKR